MQQQPRRLSKRTWLIIGGVVLVLAIIGAISNAANGNGQASTGTPTPEPTTQQGATQAVTTPTPTSKPLTVEQRAVQLAQAAAPSASQQTAKMDSSGGLTITEFRDIVSQTLVKVDCFNVQKALWQAHLQGVKDIDVQINATVGGQTANVGECSLSHELNWSGLDFNAAWSQYDTQFVAPNLDV